MKTETKKLLTAIATLSGTVMGAGFLGIPYVISKSGFLLGLMWMIILCIIMLFVNLAMAEITLTTGNIHQIPGYASKYLGKKTKIYVFIASVIGFYAALIAYLIGEAESLSFIFFNTTKFSFTIGLFFWALMAIITFKGIKSFNKSETIGVLGIFILTIILGILNFNKINFSHLTEFNPSYLFLPFGVILFAFMGLSSIPELKRVLRKNEKLMKKAVVIGSIIPLFIYILFTAVVIGLYGNNVDQIAAISLGKIVTLLGIFTMFTSFVAITVALQDTYKFDFNLSFEKSWLLSIIIPLIFYIAIKMFDIAGFIKVLSIGGSISGGLLGIFILLIHEHLKDKKLNRKPEFRISIPFIIKLLFIVLFVVGILYEFL